MPGTAAFVAADTGEADIAASVVADTAVFDIVASVVAGTAVFDIVAAVVAGTAVFDIVAAGTAVAGTAVLAVPTVYPSCSLSHLPRGRPLTRRPYPSPSHNLPLGIMGSRVFACMALRQMVLF